MRRMMAAVLLAGLLLALGTTHAQTSSPERAAVLAVIGEQEEFDPVSSASLYLLNDGQASMIDLNPVIFQPGATTPAYVYGGAIDPAYTRLALLVQTGENQDQPRIDLLDLTTNAIGGAQPPGPGVISYAGLVFSPDGSQFAAAYVEDTTGSFEVMGGLVIWDAATGAIVRVKPYAELIGPDANAAFGWPLLGAWTADGIQWHENCYACKGAFAGEWSLWDPATDTVTPATGRYFNNFFGDVLAGTGELVQSDFNTAFPNDGVFGLLPPGNTIGYYPAGVSVPPPFMAMESAFNPIYFDLSAVEFNRPLWGMDGSAIVVGDVIGQTHILERSGAITVLPSPGLTSRPLFGTRTGWAAEETGPMGRGISLVEWTNGAVGTVLPFASELPFSTRFIVVDAPDLGIGQALTQPFASPIAPPAPEAVATQMINAGRSCPGQPLSRLRPNRPAFVLPGTPNNLRELPSTDATILAEIPGEGVFNVLSGPICEGGLVWWQVEYNGTPGYTVEIIDGQYVAEPITF